jgi:RNA polymerase sigma-70 factor (ECF subfamily)
MDPLMEFENLDSRGFDENKENPEVTPERLQNIFAGKKSETGSEELGLSEISIEELTADDLSIEELAQQELAPMPVEDGPDELLARKFLDGSDQAFIELYAKYETPLLMYCRRIMFSDKIAEDAFQESWIRIFELRNRKIEVTCFKALLFRIARNLCLNIIRMERSHSETTAGIIIQMTPREESSHDTEQREIKTLLTRALAKLPFEQREAFVLHEYSGYPYHEIARIMGTTETNVKVRSYRARLRLRKLIGSWLGLGEDDDPTNVI